MAADTSCKELGQYNLKYIEDALSLLKLVFGTDGGMTQTELCLSSGVSKNKTFRILANLEKNGILARDEQGRYRPGITTLVTARKIVSRENYGDAIRPVLEYVAGRLNEAVYLAATEDGRAVLIDMVDCCQSVRVRPFTGAITSVWTDGMDALSPSCREVRDGVTITVGDLDPEVTTLSIDIETSSGSVAGALVVIAPTYRLPTGRIRDEVIPVMHEAVQQAARILTGTTHRILQPLTVGPESKRVCNRRYVAEKGRPRVGALSRSR